MFATGKSSQLPVVVIDKKGRPVKGAAIWLVIDKPKKGVAVITQVKVKLK